MSVFCFFKFFNRRSLSHTIHGIFLHMKLRPVLRFFLILDKNAPVFYRWKICPHIRFFPAKFFFFFYRHICSVIPWGNACEAAEIIDYINSSAPVSSTETVMRVFIASAGVFVSCMFPVHQFLYLFSTSHGLFSIPLRHTQSLSLPKTSSGKCSNRTGCSLPS